MTADAKPLGWCVCANISDHLRGGPDPDKFYQGTRTFSPGTKVYLGEAYWGMGAQDMHVIGLRRVSRKWVNCVIRTDVLEHLRVTAVDSQTSWERLERLGAKHFADPKDAQEYCDVCTNIVGLEQAEKLKPDIKTGPWGTYNVDRYRKP